jgi:hypothetical protein
MALAYQNGDRVNEVKFVIKNAEVIGAKIVEGETDVYFKLRYTDADGEVKENFFLESILEKATNQDIA